MVLHGRSPRKRKHYQVRSHSLAWQEFREFVDGTVPKRHQDELDFSSVFMSLNPGAIIWPSTRVMVTTHLKSNCSSSPVLKWLPYNDEKSIHASAVVLFPFLTGWK